ncbi:hypothetical protein CDL15_Pgr016722 [Punica granatum]|uniref:Uncharacterized protein n=1 Tax=Punica granatum TaxID=22663 RepID=A0A218XU46_PUNGR|nr:hypothetical protein CDL15_Pgr016722 [Punica granatum]PKI31634.1 hypothetical protein CRG98_047975 [Punica granatum]
MATKEGLRQIGLEGFTAIERYYPCPRPPGPPHKRMGEGKELPPVGPYQIQYPPQELYGNWPARRFPASEAAATDAIKAAQLCGGIIMIEYGRRPHPGPPRNIQFSRLFPPKQPNPPKRMGEGKELPPVGPYQVQYPPKELYGNRPVRRFPASDAAATDIVEAA